MPDPQLHIIFRQCRSQSWKFSDPCSLINEWKKDMLPAGFWNYQLEASDLAASSFGVCATAMHDESSNVSRIICFMEDFRILVTRGPGDERHPDGPVSARSMPMVAAATANPLTCERRPRSTHFLPTTMYKERYRPR